MQLSNNYLYEEKKNNNHCSNLLLKYNGAYTKRVSENNLHIK